MRAMLHYCGVLLLLFVLSIQFSLLINYLLPFEKHITLYVINLNPSKKKKKHIRIC